MTHEELCERARRWLAGTRKCDPVFSNIASCREIPDAIGWSSCHEWRGSTVIECKTSIEDFRADEKKYFQWRTPDGCVYPSQRLSKKEAKELHCLKTPIPNMGDYRFYLCPIGIGITKEVMERYAPDHGLLLADGRVIWKHIDAPRRITGVSKDLEIRYLRFAIINRKQKYIYDAADFQEGNEICSYA